MIVIVTFANDLHALAVSRRIRELSGYACHIVECDNIAQRASLSLTLGSNSSDYVTTTALDKISISDAQLIWLRRPRGLQNIEDVDDEKVREIINNDCRGALTGLLHSRFKGKWISNPEATYRASDKIYQLSVAHAAGFRVPRTLVSQSKDEVSRFHSENCGAIIVKAVVGAHQTFLLTRAIEDPDIFEENSYMASPAIYQEYIPGNRHIRLHCFGNRSFAVEIITDDVDWRPNLKSPISSWPVPDALHVRVRKVLDALGLEMGIVDLKQDTSGDFVWFEVNPQGQFIYLDALTDLDLTTKFAKYIVSSCENVMGSALD
jgi:glutathione synthase/RimK-type ligase-like ATP-grasp enzyme